MVQPEREVFVTDGAKRTVAWLRAHDLSVTRFCAMHDIDRIEMGRVLSGKRVRVSVDFALDVSRATGGEIKVEWFAHSRAVRKKLFERRSQVRRRPAAA